MKKAIHSFIPSLSWIKSYSKKDFLGDLPAGITVGVLLIPQGIAYALIAGLPPIYGLYAALVPQVIYAFLGTSRQLAVGPVATESLMVFAGLSTVAAVGSENYIALAISLAFLMGAIQFLMGVLKLGFLVNFLSKPVISGFTSAIAVIIAVNQLNNLLGTVTERSSSFITLSTRLIAQLNSIQLPTLLFSAGTIFSLVFLKKILPKIPATIVIVVISLLLFNLIDISSFGIKTLGDLPSGLPDFSIPLLDLGTITQLLPLAFTLAIIAYMESISIGKRLEQDEPIEYLEPNQELVALGTANMLGSLFQSYTASGGFSRTAVNKRVGAKTGISSLIAALVVGLTLFAFTSIFYNLPLLTLGAIIFVAVIGLVDLKFPIRLWKNRKDEFFLLVFTFVVTLLAGISEGIVSGVLLSLLLMLFRNTRPHIAVLAQIPGTNMYKNVTRFPQAKPDDEVLIVRCDSQLFFGNAAFFKEKLKRLIDQKGTQLRLIILCFDGVNHIDSSAAAMLLKMFKNLLAEQKQIKITNAIGPVRDILKTSDITALLGSKNFYVSIDDAVKAYHGVTDDSKNDIVLQSNK